jgi:hypothetical protein
MRSGKGAGCRVSTHGVARQRGVVMLWALMCVALMSIYLMKVGQMWATNIRRANEDELLRRGDAIRSGIQSFVRAESSNAFPRNFEDLLRDPRASFVRRHLRAAYADPMTRGDWQIVKGPNGEFYGVYSASQDVPFKRDEFSDADAGFSLQTSYEEWKFVTYPSNGMVRR